MIGLVCPSTLLSSPVFSRRDEIRLSVGLVETQREFAVAVQLQSAHHFPSKPTFCSSDVEEQCLSDCKETPKKKKSARCCVANGWLSDLNADASFH